MVKTAKSTMREIDPADLPAKTVHGLLTAVVVPRPIAWVSSRSPDGTLNLAPHSYFTVVGHQPPMLAFTSTGRKDSLRNIEADGEYVINIASEDLGERLNLTAADLPPEESEFAWARLTPAPSRVVGPPAVAEAPVALEMRLHEIREYGDPPCFLIVGEVVHLRIDEGVLRDDKVAPDLLRAFGRMAGSTYSRTTDRFDMVRPTYAGLLAQGRQRGNGQAE